MPFFLYHDSTKVTGRALAAALGIAHGMTPLQGVQATDVVRWGNASNQIVIAGNVINQAQAILSASDKYKSLELMEAAGVNVPAFDKSPHDFSYPFIGRNYSHTRGKDIVLVLQRKDYEANASDYYMEYIPKIREYRVHVFGGEVIATAIKHLTDPVLHRKAPWCWNHGKGYAFVTPEKRPAADRLDQCVRAVKSLGLDFGAVDMIVGEDEETYVLEVNTAPGLSPKTAAVYCDRFASELHLGTPDYSKLEVLRG